MLSVCVSGNNCDIKSRCLAAPTGERAFRPPGGDGVMLRCPGTSEAADPPAGPRELPILKLPRRMLLGEDDGLMSPGTGPDMPSYRGMSPTGESEPGVLDRTRVLWGGGAAGEGMPLCVVWICCRRPVTTHTQNGQFQSPTPRAPHRSSNPLCFCSHKREQRQPTGGPYTGTAGIHGSSGCGALARCQWANTVPRVPSVRCVACPTGSGKGCCF
jgi:hypothetical protein